MRHYLVVAHKTLVGPELLAEVARRMEAEPSDFHLLVPVTHPTDHGWSNGEVEARARERLTEGLERFAEIGATTTGEIGDQNPVAGVLAVKRNREIDEVILSTLPPGPSRWLKLDVPTRLRAQLRIPVTVVTATRDRV